MAGRPGTRPPPDGAALRRRTLVIAWTTLALASLHFIDHVVRGRHVIEAGLDPSWNHSGWPFLPEVTPFNASLVGVYGLLGSGSGSAAGTGWEPATGSPWPCCSEPWWWRCTSPAPVPRHRR